MVFTKKLPVSVPATLDTSDYYYEREGIDDVFCSWIKEKYTVVIYGGPKQGKSWLIKHNLSKAHCDKITIHCNSDWQLEDLYGQICKRVGFMRVETVIRNNNVNAGVNSKIELQYEFGKVELGGSAGGSHSVETRSVTMGFNITEPGDVINALKSVGFSNYIVLEQFHYLPRKVQRVFAEHLSAFIESDYPIPFIISGVWSDPLYLQNICGDLRGRIQVVDAGAWSNDHLREFIDGYLNTVNVSFNLTNTGDLVQLCHNDLHTLMQYCKHSYHTGKPKIPANGKVQIPLHPPIGPDYDYKRVLQEFSKGYRITKYEMYKRILRVVLMADIKELEAGIDVKTLCDRIKSVDKKGQDLTVYHLNRSLNSLVPLQMYRNIKPILFDYHKAEKKLCIVDKAFIPWLEKQSRRELIDELNLKFSND